MPPHTLTDLATELLLKIFQDLNAEDILNIGVLCRRLALVAAPIYLARMGFPDPETSCIIRPGRRGSRYLDELTALTINFSLVSMKQLVCVFTDQRQLKGTSRSSSAISTLTWNIQRVNKLISRLSSVGTVAIIFYSMGTQWSLQSDIVQEFMAAFFELLDTIMKRSCISLQILHPHSIAFQTNYRFQLRTPQSLAWEGIRRFFVKNIDLTTIEDDGLHGHGWRYRKLSSLKPIPLSKTPVILQSKLTKLDIRSDFLLLPPFAPWIFGVLKSSPVSSLALSLPGSIPADEFRHYIFPRIIDALPQLQEMKFGFYYRDSLSVVVESLPLFPRLRKIVFGTHSVGFFSPIIWSSGPHDLTRLDSCTGTLDQVVYFLKQPISCRNLKSVNIIVDINFQGNYLNSQDNSDIITVATRFSILNTRLSELDVEPEVTICVVTHGAPFSPRLQVGNISDKDRWIKNFNRVSRLNLELPFFIPHVNEFNHQADYVLSWLDLFRSLKALSLVSRHFSQDTTTQEVRRSTILAAIRTEHLNIATFEIVDQSGSCHGHWRNSGDDLGQYKAPTACVCSDF